MSGEGTSIPAPESFRFSGVAPERGRNRPGVLRERFDAMKDVALEQAMEKGDSWARKVGEGASGVKLDDIPKLIAELGLKLVDASRICVTPAEMRQFEAYKVLAAAHLTPSGPKLEQDFDR